MSFQKRITIIREIEKLRDSRVLCYLTSVRQGVQVQMAEDAVRIFFDHLLRLPKKPIKRLDIFLCSNGGSGTVPWRLVSLFREYAEHFGALLPYRAYSAATMLALGADEIVMHPFAEMGPIDPTVTNDYNPIDPQTNQKIGISVEGEHRQRLRADLAVGVAFLLVVHQGALSDHCCDALNSLQTCALSPRASADHPWSGRIRLDTMFTANASTVALKKNDIAPCRVVSRRIVLLVIWTSDTWAVIATTSE
jgi:hypothetical protein